jgi:TatD DNase family protein
MIDTHCHLTFPQLQDRLDDVLHRAREAGVDRMISVGTTPADADAARQIAEARDGVWFSAGVHPHYAADVAEHDLPAVLEYIEHERCAACGEMGLDYHYDEPAPDVQQEVFRRQLELVRQIDIFRGPVIIHCRKAVDDTIAMIRESGVDPARFVFHCFTESPDDARRVLDLGAMLSFTGIVTYRNAADVQAAAKLVPDDRLMVETDAPYLTPEPHRKVRPNEPRYVVDTARFLAELRGTDADAFADTVDRNAERFFGLDGA